MLIQAVILLLCIVITIFAFDISFNLRRLVKHNANIYKKLSEK